ncbi:MAG: type VI secretion system-associated FHA domain protein TagH [Magnetococcus sp. DMHC-1]
MKLVLRMTDIVASAPEVPLSSHTFDEFGGTVGRSTNNTWVLPDPQKRLSRNHFAIYFRSNSFWLTDTSTNGVEVNGLHTSYGDSVCIKEGDRLQLGDYGIVVQVDARDEELSIKKDGAKGPTSFAGADIFAHPGGFPEEGKGKLGGVGFATARKESPADQELDTIDRLLAGCAVVAAPELDDLDLPTAPPPPKVQSIQTGRWEGSSETLFHVTAVKPHRVGGSVSDHTPVEHDLLPLPPLPHTLSRTSSSLAPDPGRADLRSRDSGLSGGDDHKRAAPPSKSSPKAIPEDFLDDLGSILAPRSTEKQPEDFLDDLGSILAPNSAVKKQEEPAGDTSPVAPTLAKEADQKSVALLDDEEKGIPTEERKESCESYARMLPVEEAGGASLKKEPSQVGRLPERAGWVGSSDAEAMWQLFLRGVGVDADKVGETNPREAIQAAGVLFRTVIIGLRGLLQARATIKAEMDVEQTLVAVRDNNPLKVYDDLEELLLAVVGPPRVGFLVGKEAVESAVSDLVNHEMAMLASFQEMMLYLLGQLDPGIVEQQTGEVKGLGGMLPTANKARCWDRYLVTYARVAEQCRERGGSSLGGDFSASYRRQVTKMSESD